MTPLPGLDPSLPPSSPSPHQPRPPHSSSLVTTLALLVLAFAFCLLGTLCFIFGAPSPIGIIALSLAGGFLVSALLTYMRSFLKPLPEKPCIPQLHPQAKPREEAIPPPKMSPTKIPPQKIPIICPSSWTLDTVAEKLKSLFDLPSPSSEIPDKKVIFSLKGKRFPQFILNCFEGHPFDQPLPTSTRGAFVVQVNSCMSYDDNIGRTLAILTRVDKSCWETICSQVPLIQGIRTLRYGQSICGEWEQKDKKVLSPATHLILVYPPTLSSLLSLEQTRDLKGKALTLANINKTQAFCALVKTYTNIFEICRNNGIEHLQLDLFGTKDLYSGQEDYETWQCGCQLAFLESLRHLFIQGEEPPLLSITLQNYKEVPLLQGARKAFPKD
ncbi:hypothetical protein [Chlamydia pecorum]|uniref:hypothetical protein n=1 Tax=Chlamydia pecorum TaxID=85991 RepID=UPI0003ADF03A|nr:hypothetical protein [Chlamydia pecorum]AGW39667.1 hypothetical protein CPE3_0323 [Chlamydia pecorum P787]